MPAYNSSEALTLLQLNQRIGAILAAAHGVSDVWITAETSDVRSTGGHCYMELVQKDSAGRPLAKARAVIWQTAFARLGAMFFAATGSHLASDMKVMVKVNVNFHAVYGMSLVICDINPDYTVGDLARRRNKIIARLRDEGVFDLNRTLPWSLTPWRIAVISSRGAAGYGDFVKHLYSNPLRLRFSTTIFEAYLQGERTVPSIVAALDAIAAREDEFDCVVIIRGGGAVSDLASFDDYTLAANVAQFPLPVIVGIGHERDITVLDYVAAERVKTPTAAAGLLISRMSAAYERMRNLGRNILTTVSEHIAAQKQQLAYYHGRIPALARAVLDSWKLRLGPQITEGLRASLQYSLRRRADRLSAIAELIDTLAPEATLRRGYSITRIDGHAVTDSTSITPGTIMHTTFAKGEEIKSTSF